MQMKNEELRFWKKRYIFKKYHISTVLTRFW